MITPLDASRKPDVKRFVTLERNILQAYSRYISEMDDDVRKLLTGKSLAAKDWEMALFVASRSGQDVGRCAAIINLKFQAEKQAGAGFIGFFAAAENCQPEISEMLRSAEDWLAGRGVTRVLAPANGGAPQSMGFLASGFDEDPMFPFPWHPPYYQAYLDQAGYQPAYPLWYYEVDFTSEKYQAARQRYQTLSTAVIRPISKKHWNADIASLTHLLNATFAEEWEFATVEVDMMQEFFGPMKSILDPRHIQVAEVDGVPVGFCFSLPDFTPLFRSFKGRMGLGSIFRLLTRAKHYQRAGILGIGVLDAYRGKGISKALALKVYEFFESKGLSSGLYYPVNESNTVSRGFAESIGGTGRLTYMVSDKVVNP